MKTIKFKKMKKYLFMVIALITLTVSAQKINNISEKTIYSNPLGAHSIKEYSDGFILWMWQDQEYGLDYKGIVFTNKESLNSFLKFLGKVSEEPGDVSMQDVTKYYPQGKYEELWVSKRGSYITIWLEDTILYYTKFSKKMPLKIYQKINKL